MLSLADGSDGLGNRLFNLGLSDDGSVDDGGLSGSLGGSLSGGDSRDRLSRCDVLLLDGASSLGLGAEKTSDLAEHRLVL